jgi:hypothetical protein
MAARRKTQRSTEHYTSNKSSSNTNPTKIPVWTPEREIATFPPGVPGYVKYMMINYWSIIDNNKNVDI